MIIHIKLCRYLGLQILYAHLMYHQNSILGACACPTGCPGFRLANSGGDAQKTSRRIGRGESTIACTGDSNAMVDWTWKWGYIELESSRRCKYVDVRGIQWDKMGFHQWDIFKFIYIQFIYNIITVIEMGNPFCYTRILMGTCLGVARSNLEIVWSHGETLDYTLYTYINLLGLVISSLIGNYHGQQEDDSMESLLRIAAALIALLQVAQETDLKERYRQETTG